MRASDGLPTISEIKTPESGFSPLTWLLYGEWPPAAAARLAQRLTRWRRKPWRFGSTVIAIRHADILDLLRRDLDFLIGPVNEERIVAVNGPFVLGMDRSPVLAKERGALYSALAAVDLGAARRDLLERAAARRDKLGGSFDAITDFARPLAAETASRLFGIAPEDKALFAEVARAIFAHTFLNVNGDNAIENRALKAAVAMRYWFGNEIVRRRASGELGSDFMGQLLRQAQLDDDGVRRTLGGMYVGSIDTTVTAVAKILHMAMADPGLAAAIVARWKSGADIYGYCLDVLRRWPHNPVVVRSAANDTTLAGQQVKAGDRVIAWTQAGMLDPGAFPDPTRTLPERPLGSYLHFGEGLHPCAGRAVNSFQIPILVAKLLEAGVERTGSMKWAGPFPNRLPVRVKGAQS